MALENYIEMRDTVRDPRFQRHKALSVELERRFPDRFIPRYSMVMFHPEIPYAEALRRGNVQAEILTQLDRAASQAPLPPRSARADRGTSPRALNAGAGPACAHCRCDGDHSQWNPRASTPSRVAASAMYSTSAQTSLSSRVFSASIFASNLAMRLSHHRFSLDCRASHLASPSYSGAGHQSSR